MRPDRSGALGGYQIWFKALGEGAGILALLKPNSYFEHRPHRAEGARNFGQSPRAVSCSFRNGQRRLIFGPIDDLEEHSPREHMRFESTTPGAASPVLSENRLTFTDRKLETLIPGMY